MILCRKAVLQAFLVHSCLFRMSGQICNLVHLSFDRRVPDINHNFDYCRPYFVKTYSSTAGLWIHLLDRVGRKTNLLQF